MHFYKTDKNVSFHTIPFKPQLNKCEEFKNVHGTCPKTKKETIPNGANNVIQSKIILLLLCLDVLIILLKDDIYF